MGCCGKRSGGSIMLCAGHLLPGRSRPCDGDGTAARARFGPRDVTSCAKERLPVRAKQEQRCWPQTPLLPAAR